MSKFILLRKVQSELFGLNMDVGKSWTWCLLSASSSFSNHPVTRASYFGLVFCFSYRKTNQSKQRISVMCGALRLNGANKFLANETYLQSGISSIC